jgi:DNA (cytosine-5)-methyltransferase 1
MSAPWAIDAFAGAGGMSVGLSEAGFDLALAFDNNDLALMTYDKNLGSHTLSTDAAVLRGDRLLDQVGLASGVLPLLAGGPPCQGFSRQRRGPDDDDRNRLVFEFLRLIAEVRPVTFLMENVAALAGRRGEAVLKEFIRGAGRLGYDTHAQVLDAVDYGVPQYRKRLFVAGVPAGAPFAFPTPIGLAPVSVRQAIGDLPDPFLAPDAARQIPNHEPDNISDLNRERIRHVPEGGGRADIPESLRLPCHRVSVEKAGHRGVYGRLSWDRPAGTITTRCNSFTRGRFAHPTADRNITMREAARLQGFDDSFVFYGGRVDIAHQIGNAVPPPLAAAVGRALLLVLG